MRSDPAALQILGGLVCDGTGSEPVPADLAIEAGRIAAVAPPGGIPHPGGASPAVIDASGYIVTPGFVDLHSHSDLIFPLPTERAGPLLEGRIRQGITTEIVANCGLGAAPAAGPAPGLLRGILGWMTPDGGAGSWTGVGAWLDAVESAGPCINVGMLVPHGPLRLSVMELRAGPADDAERRRMGAALERGLEEGAFGLSSGLIYPPGMFTPASELLFLARSVARADRIYTSHIRGSSELLLPAVDELLAVGRVAGCRVHHSHAEAVGRRWWKEIPAMLARHEAARADGVRISYDMFPYTVAATMMLAIYPPWALEGGLRALLERLGRPAERRRIGADIASRRPEWPPWTAGGWPHNLVGAVGWSGIAVASVRSARNAPAVGLTLDELGRTRGRDPFDAISDLMIEEDGEVGQWVFEISGPPPHAGDADAALAPLATHPAGAFCSDAIDTGRGRPHPAAWGAFPHALGSLVRERRLLGFAEAIRKMTSLPADLLGLRDRGRIASGCAADLVILDPAVVSGPADLHEPRQPAVGIRHVLVNGRALLREGRFLPAAAGRVLRAGEFAHRG